MYPLSPYAVPYGSFRTPVDIPASNPFDDPLYQVCVNRDWLPYIAGSLKQLLLQSTWNFMSEADLQDVQGRVFDLISAFNQVNSGCGIPVPSKMCLSGTFVDGDYGYSPDVGMVCTNPYVMGTGFVSCDDGSGNQIINVGRSFTGSTSTESYSFSFPTGVFAGNISVSIQWSLGGSVVRTDSYTLLPTGRQASSGSPVTADAVDIFATFLQTIPADSMVLTDWSLCYDGLFPLSTPPEFFDHLFDFSGSDGGWVGEACGPCSPITLATYVSSFGWEGVSFTLSGHDAYASNIHRFFTSRVLTHIKVVYDAVDGNYGAGNIADALRVYLAGTDVTDTITSAPAPDGTGVIVEWFGSQESDHISFSSWKAWSFSGIGSAYALIRSVEVWGNGIDPF